MNCLFLVSLLFSSTLGAPQLVAQQLGEPVVRIVARPRAVAHHIAPAAGPFTIRANPPVLVSNAVETPVPLPVSPALISASRASAFPAVPSPALVPVNAEPSVFQTADGRVFALSNGANNIQPGQLFQLSDGRIFTAAVGNPEVKQESLFDQNDAVVEALKNAERTAAEDISSTSAPVEEPATEADLEAELKEVAVQEEEKKEENIEAPVAIRTSPALIQAPAPQLLGVQPLLSPFPSVQRFAAVPAKAQAVVAVQKSPATFSFSDAVSTQYFNYPNFGIAYEF